MGGVIHVGIVVFEADRPICYEAEVVSSETGRKAPPGKLGYVRAPVKRLSPVGHT